MRSDTTTLTSPQDGVPLFVRTWLPNGEAKGVVHLAHGMAEHSARYERLAQALTDAGYAAWIHDHRGHGETSTEEGDRGYFADTHGWDTAVEDLHTVSLAIQAAHPDLPLFFLGHSMGSLLGRDYVTRYLERDGGLRWIKLGDGKAWVIRAADMFTCLECLMVQGVTIYRDPAEGRVPDSERKDFGAGSRASAQIGPEDRQRQAASA